uniref:Uncharacterized protein n=1 Tax=Tanacetum cinerariifolium TaxID=118510 RepID=A0A699HR24_TANCI|nr:hypothetical protein [Tanacetum cinerariifolium]
MKVEMKIEQLQLQLETFPSLAWSSETEGEELDLSALEFRWTFEREDKKLMHLYSATIRVEAKGWLGLESMAELD